MHRQSEPHKIGGAAIDSTEARRILRLLDNSSQGELNATAIRLGLVTASADAATTNRRLRDLAEGRPATARCREAPMIGAHGVAPTRGGEQ